MDNIEEKLGLLKREIMDRPCVKEYLQLRAQIEQNEELSSLRDEIRSAQRQLSLSMGDAAKHAANKGKYIQLQAKYDNHPLIVNFASVKEDVDELLKSTAKLLE